ncbi:hypothetical protein CONPUDRAFT_70417 [Coniophora puteana RWD-64-598 SS2]|uniref:Secreted protein n=1 Tax=Coniophora puteana (strain RWD-64-598) TaxID=741705 RepID=A0A5M3N486_CONPW|nr:uncharacterized protein CONPUDRAFT_70417 [Coniophora puteana RWD-64-598 SS2]EIW85665.1 hypothetical protein CONPUDRAFT_70417 [Coniophora puteana RWD-64-598 SS2]
MFNAKSLLVVHGLVLGLSLAVKAVRLINDGAAVFDSRGFTGLQIALVVVRNAYRISQFSHRKPSTKIAPKLQERQCRSFEENSPKHSVIRQEQGHVRYVQFRGARASDQLGWLRVTRAGVALPRTANLSESGKVGGRMRDRSLAPPRICPGTARLASACDKASGKV